jgi:hypothetical protein
MDPVYNYNVAKATIAATMHFAVAATSALENDQFQNNYQVSFFPSPAKDVLNINLGNLTDTEYSFSLIDLQGKIVIKKHVENAHLVESVSLDGLSKGIYLAVLQTSNKRIAKNIIVE